MLFPHSHCFGVKTAESYRYVDNLFAFFNRQEMRAGMEPVRAPHPAEFDRTMCAL